MTAGVCNLCIATSLAEFLSAYPTYDKMRIARICSVANDLGAAGLEGNIIGSQVSTIIYRAVYAKANILTS